MAIWVRLRNGVVVGPDTVEELEVVMKKFNLSSSDVLPVPVPVVEEKKTRRSYTRKKTMSTKQVGKALKRSGTYVRLLALAGKLPCNIEKKSGLNYYKFNKRKIHSLLKSPPKLVVSDYLKLAANGNKTAKFLAQRYTKTGEAVI